MTKRKTKRRQPAKPARARKMLKPAPALALRRPLDLSREKPVRQTRKISQIKIGKRHRRDFGDLAGLARSINELGLLQPIVIDTKNRLIGGERRIRAWELSQYRKDPIPVYVTDTVDKILRGEWAENTIRKDFTPSEAARIAAELEPALKRAAKQRQRDHGKTARGRKAASTKDKGEAREKAAKAVGIGRRTLEKAQEILAARDADPKNPELKKLVDTMDRTGRVDGPHKRLKVIEATKKIRAAPPPIPGNGPYPVVVIDFPWAGEPDTDQAELDRRGRAMRPYPEMSHVEGLKFMAEKIRPILADNVVVYFWTTNFHLVHGPRPGASYALELIAELGLAPSTMATWSKNQIGQGQILRGQTEHCIIATRGDVVFDLKNETTSWQGKGWERRENSQKPVAFYELVERLTPSPRFAEIFSCSQLAANWDTHGDQVGRHKVEPPAAAAELPFAEAPLPEQKPSPHAELADLLEISDAEVERARKSLSADFPDFAAPGHALTFKADGDEHVGECSCGEAFVFPISDKARNMDVAVERHLRRALEVSNTDDQLGIPEFLDRNKPPDSAAA